MNFDTPRKAFQIRKHGGPEVLEAVTLPPAVAGPGEVLAKVRYVALNHLDVWVRKGVPGHDFGLPRIGGSDVVVEHNGRCYALMPSRGCGRCAACLAGRQNRCRQFQILGENVDGGCVEVISVPAWQMLPIPAHLSPAAAAALPLTLLTAWHMLVVRARLQRGEKVLVQAGGSGVGVMAIQIAKLFGCEVWATSADEGRRQRLEALGAHARPYSDLPRHCDVVVETVGQGTWESSVQALSRGGRLVCCGATAGAEVQLNLRVLFFKQLDILGSTMGTNADMLRAWEEVKAGRILPIVDRVLPMDRIAEAHGLLERREVFGKVVLGWDE